MAEEVKIEEMNNEEQKEVQKEEGEWEDITENEDGGVFKMIIKEGSGHQKAEDKSDVQVHYVGTLEDGTKFDSSRDRDSIFHFALGQGAVIKGWDIGVKTMKKGEIAKFKIRGDYAYGERGSPPKIPPNATLIFEIELFDWVAEKDITDNRDGGVLKKTLKDGEGWEQPNDGTNVKIRYTVKDPETNENIENGEMSFVVGDEVTFDGLDLAVKKLKKGEIGFFKIRSDYIYNRGGNDDPSKGPILAPNANLHVDIEMLHFEKEKDSYQMENPEKIQVARQKKEEGNEFFKQGRFSLANKRYTKALNFIQYGEWKDEKEEVDQLKVSCQLNIAAIFLKNKDYRNVISELKKVLEIEPSNVKALYRRSLALTGTGEYLSALNDLQKAADLDPTNKEVKKEIARVKQLQQKQDDQDKNLYSKMLQGL